VQNDVKRMPPPKSVAIKKRKSKRPQDFLRRASAPADRSPDKRKSGEIVTGDSDSDTACGFGTNWQPSWLACRIGLFCGRSSFSDAITNIVSSATYYHDQLTPSIINNRKQINNQSLLFILYIMLYIIIIITITIV